jgi:energy-coupling factor transporter ATP-binding protein EcfA2
MFLEIVTEQAAEAVWSNRQRIIQFLKDAKRAATRGRLKLFSFGPGGCGKSTLGKLIDGTYTLETLPATYSLSIETELYGVEDRNFISLYVPPGQRMLARL